MVKLKHILFIPETKLLLAIGSHTNIIKLRFNGFLSPLVCFLQYPERVMKTAGWQTLLKDAPDVCTAIICRYSVLGSRSRRILNF